MVPDYLEQLFTDPEIRNRIKRKMPPFFQLAEADTSRGGKLGMEVGSAREKVIVALLMYKFGEENIKTESITSSESDAFLFEKPVSIKTITGGLGGVKLIWTVDTKKVLEFYAKYKPSMDLLLAQINWGGVGGFYYITTDVQAKVFKKLGKKRYIKLPKVGTNPRGVEFTREALQLMVLDKRTHKIEINWDRSQNSYNPYERWIKLWGD